jgi:uroporphyrinogen-III synthase
MTSALARQLTLMGKRIIVTRAAHQADELADLLRTRGATPLLYPCIAISPPENTDLLDSALHAAFRGEFDWLVVTSANTVNALAEQIKALGLNSADLARIRIAAVGAATSAAVKLALGLVVNTLPDEFHDEALAHAINLQDGARVLLPQADIARPTLAQALNKRGAQVSTVTAYRNVIGSGGVNVPALLANDEVDVITFTSSSTVRNFHQRLIVEGGSAEQLAGICTVCIGSSTLKTAREYGLSHAIAPDTHTLEQLVRTIEDYFDVVEDRRKNHQPDQ